MNTRWWGVLGAWTVAAVAGAWNGHGHQQIADIAWARLSRQTRIEIAKILASGDAVSRGDNSTEFGVTPPTNGYTDAYLEKVVRPMFDRAATWCDDIKSGSSANYDARIDADNAASPGVHPPANGGRRGEDNRCKTWHYYDDPIVVPGDTAPHPARDSNAVRALGIVRPDFESQEKQSSPDRKEQLYDLFWIEHLFGDLAQPLHCSESYVLDPKGDAGGNTLMTLEPNGSEPLRRVNLHSFWDSGIDHAIAADPALGKSADYATVTSSWLAEGGAVVSSRSAHDLDPMSWVRQGHDLAVKVVYPGIAPMSTPSDAYDALQDTVCKKQALLAGARLAEYLNRVLGSRKV